MTAHASSHVRTHISNGTGFITLDRPKALNSLSLDMVRAITAALLAWRDDASVAAVVMRSSSEKALCAGGDIRFFREMGLATPQGGSALLEDFFTEEYALNHLIHFYDKPYISLMDGVVMGGGMGIAQGGPACGVRIVSGRVKMAMPEVNIGLFPDVGGSHFLSHAPGSLGMWLALTGLTIGAADALYVGLADHYVPESDWSALAALVEATPGHALRAAIAAFAAPFAAPLMAAAASGLPAASGANATSATNASAAGLQADRALVDRHFSAGSVAAIMASLRLDGGEFARRSLAAMEQRSPLMMCVTHEMLRRGAALGVADCLRMERNLVRRNFEHGEILEGVRALVVDKDNSPRWNPSTLDAVTPEMVARFFEPCWPAHAHPLRHLA